MLVWLAYSGIAQADEGSVLAALTKVKALTRVPIPRDPRPSPAPRRQR